MGLGAGSVGRIRGDGDNVAGDLVQTLLTCKHMYTQKEKAPLTDEEYDNLMAIYAELRNADSTDVHQQLQEFRNGVGHLSAKKAALKAAPREGVHHMFQVEYRLEKG